MRPQQLHEHIANNGRKRNPRRVRDEISQSSNHPLAGELARATNRTSVKLSIEYMVEHRENDAHCEEKNHLNSRPKEGVCWL
jgi:hypothetical protein